MKYIMPVAKYVGILIDIAKNYNTTYAKGMFGFPITEQNLKAKLNQNLVKSWYTANMSRLRTHLGQNCFGFDCNNLLKAPLYGWSGDFSKQYGGATYLANGVPDFGDWNALSYCDDVSSDFSDIVPGEWVWLQGHVGCYVGNGLVAEATMSWDKKVLISKLSARRWLKHGKPKWIDFGVKEETIKPVEVSSSYDSDVHEWQNACIIDGFEFLLWGADGEWGDECRGVAGDSAMSIKLVGKKCQRVIFLQLMLKALGYYSGAIDGLFGPKTDAAVRKFQEEHDLKVDGIAGPKTMECLFSLK